MLYPHLNSNNDKLIISFSLPYQYFIKPFNTYHESLILSEWRINSSSISNSSSSSNVLNLFDDNNNTTNGINNTSAKSKKNIVDEKNEIGNNKNGLEHSNIDSSHFNENSSNLIFDNLTSLRIIVNQLNEFYASYGIIIILNEFRISNLKITISIIGQNQFKSEMNDIKSKILKNYSQISKSVISLDPLKNKFCYSNTNDIKLELLNFISSVSNFNNCSIFIELGDNFNYIISIIGFRDKVKVTENKINLFIDNMNPQFFSDYLELSSISILPLICGTNLSTLKKIIKQTNCNIYLPNLLPELFYNNSLEIELGNPKIFLTGLRSQVLLAKKWLSDMILKYTKNPFVKQLSILPVKREFLIVNEINNQNCDFFDNLMFQTSCYLSIPPLGSINSNSSTISANIVNTNNASSLFLNNLSHNSNTNDHINKISNNTSSNNSSNNSQNGNNNSNKTNNINSGINSNNNNSVVGDIITVQGNSIEEVEILIDELTNKLSTYYSEKIELTLQNNDHIVDINKLLNFNDSLAFNSNCFITCSKTENKYIFQILGNSENIKVATNCLTQFSSFINEAFKNQFIQYQIELPNKEKDFIAGKKNGKIIKIINMSSVSIKLLPYNDQNFIVEISGNDLLDSLLGLGLFEDELPTIFHFNVPESFHRQIIGVGGQTIQIIMRKFNVFVKFSNSFELSDKTLDNQHILQSTNFQQSFIRKNNVVIKCPSKNKSEIPLAKLELEKLVEKVKKNSYSCSIVKLSIQQWKLLTSSEFNILYNINRKKPTNFITELEKKTNTFINYPPLDAISNNLTSVTLEVFGIENNSKMCVLELKKIIPYSYKFNIEKDLNILQLLKVLQMDKLQLFQLDNISPLQLNFLNNIIIPMKLLYNIELGIKINDQFDSIVAYYYPHSFGFTYNVLNPERLNEQSQLQIISSNSFNQVISGMTKFLDDWSFCFRNSEIENTDLMTQDLGFQHSHSVESSHSSSINNSNNTTPLHTHNSSQKSKNNHSNIW